MSIGVIVLILRRMVRLKYGILASIGAASQLEPQRYACILFCYSYRVASMFRNMLSIYLATPTLKHVKANRTQIDVTAIIHLIKCFSLNPRRASRRLLV